jgi:hypothetical protein
MKQEVGFFLKISKIDKLLDRLTIVKRVRNSIKRIRHEKGYIAKMSIKSRVSLRNTSKPYILIDWKI